MNKALTSIAAAAVALTLVACGSSNDVDSTSPGSAQVPSTATTEAAPSASRAPADDVSPNGETPITITAGDTEIEATLNDSEVSQDLIEMLPVTTSWFRNSGIEYITELDEPLTETGPFYTDVQPGDLVYYNPADSLTIIYEETSSVPTLTKMGEITSDLDVFRGLPDNTEMRIERG